MSKNRQWVDKLLERHKCCCICGSTKDLEAHHVVEVNYYDDLYDSIGNGVVMCHDCHHEYHQTYYGDINLMSLLFFRGKKDGENCKKLKAKYKRLRKQYNNLLNKE